MTSAGISRDQDEPLARRAGAASAGGHTIYVGASDALSAVIGAAVLVVPAVELQYAVVLVIPFPPLPLPVWRSIHLPVWLAGTAWFVVEFCQSLGMQRTGPGGLAHGAHVGGFLAGFLVAGAALIAAGRNPS